MATPSVRNIRREKVAVTYATASSGYVVYSLDGLGQEGCLVHLTFRMASGSATTCAIRIFEGVYADTASGSPTNPALVPDEDIVADYAAAAVSASTTTATIIENISGDDRGAYYGRIDLKQYVPDAEREGLFVALTFDNTCTGVLRLRAEKVA